MNKVVRALILVLFVIGVAASVASCLQAEGQRCQVTDDCEGVLICCVRDDTASRIAGGICTQPNKCELVIPDVGVIDAAASDAGADSDASDATSSDVDPDTEPDTTTDMQQPDTVSDAGADDATPDTTPDTSSDAV